MCGKYIDLPPHSAAAAGLPTKANEQSISLRYLCFLPYLRRKLRQKSFVILVPGGKKKENLTKKQQEEDEEDEPEEKEKENALE